MHVLLGSAERDRGRAGLGKEGPQPDVGGAQSTRRERLVEQGVLDAVPQSGETLLEQAPGPRIQHHPAPAQEVERESRGGDGIAQLVGEAGEPRRITPPAIPLALERQLHQRFHRGLGEGVREQPLLHGAHPGDLFQRNVEEEPSHEAALQGRAARVPVG